MDCPICKLDEADERHEGGDRHVIDCPRCGSYAISGTVFALAAASDQDLRLSAWLRSRQGTSELPAIGPNTAEQVLSGIPTYTVAEKQTLLLRSIADRTKYPGKPVDIVTRFDFVLAWAAGEEELNYLLDALKGRGLLALVDVQSAAESFHLEALVTPQGWDYLDAVARSPVLSHQGFVAMSFADELKRAWTVGIEPAIREAGYAPYRVDNDPHIDRIDAKITAKIRESKFLVADVTGQRQGVYFEAGLANGLNLPVFWCVRDDDLPNVHFDTRQYRHIVWKTEEELAVELRNLLVAVLGKGPRSERLGS
jgi:hypothetical protein